MTRTWDSAPPWLARLAELAQTRYPREGCGLLLGPAEREQVTEVWELRNVAIRPRQAFEFDPLDYLAAERRAEAAGLRAVGIWHSHPDAAAVPSEADLRAAWPQWLYVIAGTSATGITEIRGWRLRDERFIEEVLQA